MTELYKQKLRFYKAANQVKEGKIKLSKKELKFLIECLECLKDPLFGKNDLRYDITGTGNSGVSPVEPMYLENQNDLRVDTTGKPIDPHYLDEESEDPTQNTNVNPIAKTFKQDGDFEQYIQKFSGLEIKPKEYESITNYQNSKPTKADKFSIRYEKTDDFNNNTITIIKKLREGNDLVFTIFQSTTQQASTDDKTDSSGNEIVVSKSRSFRNEIEGGKILADILQKLEV